MSERSPFVGSAAACLVVAAALVVWAKVTQPTPPPLTPGVISLACDMQPSPYPECQPPRIEQVTPYVATFMVGGSVLLVLGLVGTRGRPRSRQWAGLLAGAIVVVALGFAIGPAVMRPPAATVVPVPLDCNAPHTTRQCNGR